ncbi:galactokinase [Mucilaginibacter sp. Bleaf8]|uniref:galactokinase n=1 Tax=Mucilaginibacter sp. Bleaf8 TaxID=2834430 RepID=UPI001BCAECE3|nr:galactokinase [Mucilaginibacter sp. Bleaf8]MBS7563528.1 galactokinase [Mucilaginibacter sp. Bleaf8]
MNQHLSQEFQQAYNQQPQATFFCPGRINLIGEHIDYNGGLVMPCAIDFGTTLLIAPNTEGVFRLRSLNFDETLEIPVQTAYEKTGREWYNYPLGVMHHFVQDGKEIKGLDMLYHGNLPIGSGLSSSASIEIVTAYALNEYFKSGYTKLELVIQAKSVENNFIGLNSGIMDQFAVAFGEKDKALMLNCDTLDYEAVDANLGDHVLAIISTNKPRKLAESKYNERVKECQEALADLQKELSIDYLCDIDAETFRKHQHLITNEVVLKRATHVIEENDRVKAAAAALSAGNLQEFGQLMYASHESLQNLYEVSGLELDTIVAYSKTDANVTGARMTGAGFGGCAIALVKADAFDDYSKKVTAHYTEIVGYEPSVYRTSINDGVRLLSGE